VVIARNELLLFREPEKIFPPFKGASPPIYEILLAPWHVKGEPVGTLWAIKHTPEGRFDAEDARLLQSLSHSAAAACQMISFLDEARAGRGALERRVKERTRTLFETYERIRTSEGLLEAVVRSMPVGVIVAEAPSGRLILKNEEVERIWGHPFGTTATVEDEVSPGFYPDGRPYRPDEWPLARSITTGELVEDEEINLVHSDGSRITVSVRSAPIRAPDGRIVAGVAAFQDVTRRRHAEAAARETLNELEAIYRVMPAGMAVLDHELRYVRVNEMLARINGLPEADHVGRAIREVVPAVSDQAEAIFRRVLETGEPLHGLEFDAPTPGSRGEPRVWLENMTPLLDRDGRAKCLLVTVQDITDRKRAEQALAAELRAMTRLHELTREVVLAADLKAVLATILQAAIELHGADFGNVQLFDKDTQTLQIAAQHGFRQPFLDRFAEVSANEGSACGLALARRERVVVDDVEKDPAYAPNLAVAREAGYRAVQSTPLFTTSGEPVGMLSTHFREPHRLSDSELRFTDVYARLASDAIARCKAEEALRKAQERLQSALSAGRMAAWDWDPVTDRVMASDTLPDLLGLWPGETWQSSEQWNRLVHPDDRERRKDLAEAAGRDGGSWYGEFRVIRPRDGQVVWVEERAHAVRDPQTGKVSIAGLVWDITERKQAEERLVELQGELLHLSRLGVMGEMAAVLAHELNQPLTAISNYIYGAGRLASQVDAEPSGQLRDLLQKAADQALRAGETIRRVREFVARGRSIKQPEDVLQLVREASSLALIGASGQGIRVKYQLDDQVGRVLADKIQIQQVLLNLIRNAVEAMQEVERRELLIAVRPAGAEMVEICVADTGPGISPEIAALLFQPFVTSKPEGLGVGLSVCRNIIEVHHGRLWAEPNPSGGSAFHFTLPVAVPP
jgi:two-component system sensor kinase FixL